MRMDIFGIKGHVDGPSFTSCFFLSDNDFLSSRCYQCRLSTAELSQCSTRLCTKSYEFTLNHVGQDKDSLSGDLDSVRRGVALVSFIFRPI